MNDVVLAVAGLPSRIARLTAALSASTQRCYRNGWRKWEAFALEHGATLFPATPEALAAFVEHLAAAGAKPSTIQTDLAGVSAAHRLTGITPNPATTADVRAAYQLANRGFRDAGGTVRQSAGITDEDMARIEEAAYRPRPRGKGFEPPATAKARAELDIAIIRTMRDTLARVSEAAAFTWGQIERRPDGSATITFRRPKTDADTTAYLAPATVAALPRRDPPRRSRQRVPVRLEHQPDQEPHQGRCESCRTGRGFKPRMPGRDGPGPCPDGGDRDGRDHAGRRLAIGDDGSQVHRPRECRTGRRGPVLCAERRGVAGRSARYRADTPPRCGPVRHGSVRGFPENSP